jgi:hypothetical protein
MVVSSVVLICVEIALVLLDIIKIKVTFPLKL